MVFRLGTRSSIDSPRQNLSSNFALPLGQAPAVATAICAPCVNTSTKRYGGQKADLASRRKTAPLKLEIAARLRRETTLSLKAIARQLKAGTSKAANARLQNHMKRLRGAGPDQAQVGLRENSDEQ